MKKLIREINEYTDLYRDDVTGIAWIEDGSTGMGISIHSNISDTGSVRGMTETEAIKASIKYYEPLKEDKA